MLEPSDIIAGKIVVQLGLVPAPVLVEELRALDAEPGRTSLLERLVAKSRLTVEQAATVRDRVARFHWIREEASYVHVLESEQPGEKGAVQRVLAEIERADENKVRV